VAGILSGTVTSMSSVWTTAGARSAERSRAGRELLVARCRVSPGQRDDDVEL
jgi:hypothetical protein